MMDMVERVCIFIFGASVLTLGLSFMYVCAKAVLTGNLGAPPAVLFLALFGMMGSMLVLTGACLLAGKAPRFFDL